MTMTNMDNLVAANTTGRCARVVLLFWLAAFSLSCTDAGSDIPTSPPLPELNLSLSLWNLYLSGSELKRYVISVNGHAIDNDNSYLKVIYPEVAIPSGIGTSGVLVQINVSEAISGDSICSGSWRFQPGNGYSIFFVGDDSASVSWRKAILVPVWSDASIPSAGMARVQFFHGSPYAGNIDLYVRDTTVAVATQVGYRSSASPIQIQGSSTPPRDILVVTQATERPDPMMDLVRLVQTQGTGLFPSGSRTWLLLCHAQPFSASTLIVHLSPQH